jgi:trehalose 6-phosphate phosphatase
VTFSVERMAYFLDIDGTLVDFEDSPARVRLVASHRRSLASLRRRTAGAVAIVSGRSIAEIDRIFPRTQMAAAGQHGAERRDVRGGYSRLVTDDGALRRVRDHLAGAIARHRGLLLEDKGCSLALHYRAAPTLAAYAHRLMRAQLPLIGGAFCVQRGKRVVELKPAGRDKGKAVRAFMAERPFRGRIPVFVGDDETDEYGFETVNALGGVSVKVGPGATAATLRVRDVHAVWEWIARRGALPEGTAPRRRQS